MDMSSRIIEQTAQFLSVWFTRSIAFDVRSILRKHLLACEESCFMKLHGCCFAASSVLKSVKHDIMISGNSCTQQCAGSAPTSVGTRAAELCLY